MPLVMGTHQALVTGYPFFLGPGTVTVPVEQQRLHLVLVAHDWWLEDRQSGGGKG